MATPYVPVPIPIESSSSGFTNRNQRSSSFGSISTSSSSSKGQLEDSTIGSFKKMSVPDQIGSTSSVCSSPLVRTKFTGLDTSIEYCTQPVEEIEQNADSRSWEDRPSTPTILGYEVMEERAKFTVYKILVKRSPEESWVVFRRYTDFSRLNDKVGITHRLAVREFLCLDDPPGPFDSLEESRAFCETLEETNYRLQKELLEKQREVESLKKLLSEKQLHIDAVERRIRALSLGKMTRQMSGEESECSGEVESSAVEADQGTLGEDSCSDKENHEPCWSGSLAGNSVPDIEVAEVAYTVDEE
ncbi:Sorting nexin-16 [Willisornis vidua]|uniref:Sorting nexin-16 n=1 Tax=Willisornis vidua TaxID=1566151 RepID=A0ABQ9CSI9_9PASS|nr:Sorting nexin-16 [Willisornis vidua]